MKTVSYELDITASEVMSLAKAAGLDKFHFYDSGRKIFILTLISPALERFANLVLTRNKTKPQADADGWITWGGGACPVPGDTLVEVRLRDGYEECYAAVSFRWRHAGDDKCDPYAMEEGDIIAYRIVEGD